MSTTVMLTVENGRLAPADVQNAELLSEIGNGLVTAEIRKPRNPKFHRLFFGLLNLVFKHQNIYPTLEHFLVAMKMATGHVDAYKIKEKTVYVPRSISFSKMDEAAFRQFWDKCLEIITTRIIPNTTKADLEREVYTMLGINMGDI
jgi:hypothetical protein